MLTDRQTLLLTGASTGLGLALTKKLIKLDKYNLVLTARRSSICRFQEQSILPSKYVHLLPLDVTNMDDRVSVVNECEKLFGGVDILINNAGVAMRSVVEDASADERVDLLNVNYIGPMRLIALVLPAMRERNYGKIINVSSAAGLVGMPTLACYSGSKFALEGATESLYYEVRPWNISVSLIIPGFIHSDSYKNTIQSCGSEKAISSDTHPYHLHYKAMDDLISKAMNLAMATPESVATKIIKILEAHKPPLRVPVTFDAWILFLFRRFLPRVLYHWIVVRFLPGFCKWGKDYNFMGYNQRSKY